MVSSWIYEVQQKSLFTQQIHDVFWVQAKHNKGENQKRVRDLCVGTHMCGGNVVWDSSECAQVLKCQN